MPAPAPVNVSVKLNPTTPKQKVDASREGAAGAPRFDDALEQARAKPAKSQKPSEPQAAKLQQHSKASKSKSSKRSEEAVEAPPADQASETDAALPLSEAEQAPVRAEENAIDPVEPEMTRQASVSDTTGVAAVTAQTTAPVEVAPELATTEKIASDAEVLNASAAPTTGVTPRPDAAAPQTTEATEPAEAHAAIAAGGAGAADGASPAIPEGASPFEGAPTQKKSVANAPVEQPERLSSPAAAKSTASRQPQPQGDQPPVPAMELPVEAQANADDPGTEEQQQQQPMSDNPGGTTGAGASAAKASAPAAMPTSAPAEALSAASVAPKSAPQVENAPAPAAAAAPATPREVEFARANHDRIVTDIRAQLLPKGGAMQIRLDPPQLGALQVAVHMLDGVMSVSFETSNNEATQLLSHSLTQLKHVLESQGVAVDKLHVQQAPRNEPSSHNSNDPDQSRDQRHGGQDDNLARQEQQRKEMLRRMWRRLALGNDPLDLVA